MSARLGDNKELNVLRDVAKLKSSFRGMSLENIKLLLEKFGSEEAKIYYKIRERKRDTAYKLGSLQIMVARNFICIKEGEKGKFQLTNHTLYTLLTELEKNPSDLIKIEREK